MNKTETIPQLVNSAVVDDNIEEINVLRALVPLCLDSRDQVDRKALRTAQTEFQRRGFDDNIFQVSVRVCGQILSNLHRLALVEDHVIEDFLSGRTLYSLAITEGLEDDFKQGSSVEAQTGDTYLMSLNKRLICGIDKTDFTLCFISDPPNAYLFRVDNTKIRSRQTWAFRSCKLFDLDGQIQINKQDLIAEGSLARSIVEDALYEERDGLDATNFLKAAVPFRTLTRENKISVLLCDICQKEIVFSDRDPHYRKLVILALKIATAQTAADAILSAAVQPDVKLKALSYNIAGGSELYIKSLIWDYARIYAKTITLLFKSKEIPDEFTILLKLIDEIVSKNIARTETQREMVAETILSVFLPALVLSLASDGRAKRYSMLATLYVSQTMTKNIERLAKILGTRIYDEHLDVAQLFGKLIALRTKTVL